VTDPDVSRGVLAGLAVGHEPVVEGTLRLSGSDVAGPRVALRAAGG
jgi:hypothetical protein